MGKRKSTKILEALSEPIAEEPVVEPVVEPVAEPITEPEPIIAEPVKEFPAAPKKRVRVEKDPLAEEIKKLRKMQEEQEHRLEHRLEGLIARKFMEAKNLARPVAQYKPKMHAPIQRLKVAEHHHHQPAYQPSYEDEDEYSNYLTQEESEEEPQPRSMLYSKIFG
jgi:hypothetical protein